MILAIVLCSPVVFAGTNVEQQTDNKKVATSRKPSDSIFHLPKEELEKKIANASSAEYKGGVTTDDLLSDRDKYLGKVVELKFQAGLLSTLGVETSHLYVHSANAGATDKVVLCGNDSMQWAVEVSKKAYGASSTVYALVEKKYLIALGDHKRKSGDSYTYTYESGKSSARESASDNAPSSASSSTNWVYTLSNEELEKKISEASSAEYKGGVTTDDLLSDRNKYLGKVVELKFYGSSLYTTSGGNPYIFVRSQELGSLNDQLVLCGDEALKWGIGVAKKGYGVSCTVYALVEKKGLIALGSRKRKVGDGYTYSW
jgi:hypothetical protein